MTDLARLITELGFPVVIAVFVLWRLNGKLATLIATLHEFKHTIEEYGISLRAELTAHHATLLDHREYSRRMNDLLLKELERREHTRKADD